MAVIKAITKEKVVDNSQKQLHYFACSKDSRTKDFSGDLLSAINEAEQTICIASTSNIEDSIREPLLKKIRDRIRVYGIFQDFKACLKSLAWFDDKNPALIRSNEKLQNNFIIIDNRIAFLFINPLDNINRNTCIEFSDAHVKDLFYWFTYTFWNSDENEHILKLNRPCKESPFSIPATPRRTINISESLETPFEAIESYYPQDARYKPRLNSEREEKNDIIQVLSNQIKNPLFKSGKNWKIGDFILDIIDFEGPINTWKEAHGPLSEVPKSFIDFDKNDWNPITKQDSIKKKLAKPYTVDKIEDMDNTEPPESDLECEPYAMETCFEYTVQPPSKPKNADKAAIYKQYEHLKNGHDNNTKRIRTELEDLKNKDCIKEAPGLNREISQDIESIKKEEKVDFKALPITDVENIIDKWNPDLEGNWVRQLINLKVEIKRKEFEIKKREDLADKEDCKKQKEGEKEKTNSRLEDLNNKLIDFSPKIKDPAKKSDIERNIATIKKQLEDFEKHAKDKEKSEEKDLENFDKDTKVKDLAALKEELQDYVPKNPDAKQKSSLEGEKRSLENAVPRIDREIKNIEDDIEVIKKREFNESEVRKSFENTKNNYMRIRKPDFLLPEVGELFETRDTFYLEISDDKDLEKANELANRYTGKNYKVVAKV